MLDAGENCTRNDELDAMEGIPPMEEDHQITSRRSEGGRPSPVLSEEDRLICVNYARGFSLKHKKWVELDLDGISDITWTVDAFDNLILPRQYKDVILSILESKITNTDTFDDFIEGKVAEELRRPLYSVTAGELGVEVHSLEKSLTQILKLASQWNAVLLLDEADIFMEQRSASDLRRNQLVSAKFSGLVTFSPNKSDIVFLRVVEYYNGVLFATTNRASRIDRAFKSRIDLNINYPALSSDSQREIWKRLVARSSQQASSFTEQDWAHFTESSMNGREIRNAVKLAYLLATRRKEDMTAIHDREVIGVLQGDLMSDQESSKG
ncbi:hypothetical protein ACJZ2D_012738 [Fusarium nematophilum]